MITSRLSGGLGNQMFQYALGRVLAQLNNSPLCLDLSYYYQKHTQDTPRRYELNIFPNIKNQDLPIRTKSQFSTINMIKLFLNHHLKFNSKAYPSNWIKESGHQFNPGILSLKGDYILDGYWQSEKYFKKFRESILTDFSFPSKTSKKNNEVINYLKTYTTISTHVRRGDYISNQKSADCHGVCSTQYYQKAIDLIRKQVYKPIFLIFSDDINWCKKNLPVPHKSIFVNHNNGKNSFEDMRLMSLCNHNIIANSSFSWWGAWLNKNTEKIIITPKKWFNDPKVIIKDINPSTWIKI
ncbi:MAG: alpha-1,2-fucosyltransferase [Candidatus Pacebacteria bacterium]|jgi:hypothetical protein|nr:alpha-1,2-fucosyltransferase [Candidatus Paceibacterota bacterium]